MLSDSLPHDHSGHGVVSDSLPNDHSGHCVLSDDMLMYSTNYLGFEIITRMLLDFSVFLYLSRAVIGSNI